KKKKETSVVSHKKSLEKLKEQDPDFYKFLQQEDKELLAFDDSGDDYSDDDDDDDDDDDLSERDHGSENKDIQEKETQKKIKKKGEKEKNVKNEGKTKERFMESSSENDDSSDDESEGKFHKLPEKLEVASDDSDYSGDSETEMKTTKTKKQKSRGLLVTNKMVKDWSKSIQMMTELSEPTMINVFLKHIHKLIAYYASFIKLAKILLKKCITLWSTGEETTRVLAFLCINRLVRVMQSTLLEPCLKQMYMAYVKNCKFTSPTTLPLINFMQRSLVEIFAIDFVLAYQYAFIYIRQLAIHLRNAITVKKKVKKVYQ
ncbi:hypothetical protein KUTeg_001582, partial [Tegillarca granosa]